MRTRRAVALLAAALLKQAAGAGAPTTCRDDVFGGLSADCNLGAGGSVASCCRRLALVELNACFCDAAITAAVKTAVGNDGLLFFASFARTSCGFNVTNGPACPSLTLLVAPGPPPVPQVVAPPRAPQAIAPQSPPLYGSPPPAAATGTRALADVVCDPALAFQHGFFCDALTATGLLQLLATPGPFTLFVPTNTAWYTTLVQLGLTKEELFEDPSLTEIAANHLVRGLYPSSSLYYGQQLDTMHRSAPSVSRELRSATASGVNVSAVYYAVLSAGLTVEVYQKAVFKHVFVAGAQVTQPDVRASNGLLHLVDAVLLPPPPQSLPTSRSVGQLIRERFELSMYENALAGTALLTALDAATPAAPVTVFAPSNAGFIRYAATSPGFFISDATGRAVNPGVPGLRDVLKYGLVVGRFTSGTLSAMTSPLTSVQGSALYLDYIHGVYKNYLYVNGCRARVMDLIASNGVVHILECVPQARASHCCSLAERRADAPPDARAAKLPVAV